LGAHRARQLSRRAREYGEAKDRFWNGSEELRATRHAIDQAGRAQGLPISEVVAGMRPDGQFPALRAQFDQAIQATPGAGGLQQNMDKAMDAYVDKFGVVIKEITQAGQVRDPAAHRQDLSQVMSVHRDMVQSVGEVPAFRDAQGKLGISHLDSAKQDLGAIIQQARGSIAPQAQPSESPRLG
jgi:hypothetical protein